MEGSHQHTGMSKEFLDIPQSKEIRVDGNKWDYINLSISAQQREQEQKENIIMAENICKKMCHKGSVPRFC